MSETKTAARSCQNAAAAITPNHHFQYTPEVPETSAQVYLACLFTELVEAIGSNLAKAGSHSYGDGGKNADR